MYVMQRTTVYLPDHLKHDLKRVARAAKRSEADLIREGVRVVVESYDTPRPRVPLFHSSDPMLAERVDEALDGFGER